MISQNSSETEQTSSETEASECAQLTEDLPLVSQMGFDDCEIAILQTIRNICCSMAQPGHDPLKPASTCLTKNWSITHSSAIFDGLFSLVIELRDTRTEPFHFVDPRCAHCSRYIGPSEAQLIFLLRHAQAADFKRARELSQLLAKGGDAKAIETASRNLASIICNKALTDATKFSVSEMRH